MAEHGGPISSIETGIMDVGGRRMYQANARLRGDISPKRSTGLFAPVDGTGTHRLAAVARHMAVSEAIERWALLSGLNDRDCRKWGLDEDPTSNGMAAFPGLIARQARRHAWLEAVERHCLFGWWEGRYRGNFRNTPWAGVDAVQIEGPFSETVVVLFGRTSNSAYAYGHAAGVNFRLAAERALIEQRRHELALALFDGSAPVTRLERRAIYFSRLEGFAQFWECVERGLADRPPPGVADQPLIAFDGQIRGPWSQYAHVWRVAFKPVSRRFLEDGDAYLFW